jgi:hypothetical protein
VLREEKLQENRSQRRRDDVMGFPIESAVATVGECGRQRLRSFAYEGGALATVNDERR